MGILGARDSCADQEGERSFSEGSGATEGEVGWDYSIFKTFAIPFIYSSTVAARKAKNFPIVTVAQARALWGS